MNKPPQYRLVVARDCCFFMDCKSPRSCWFRLYFGTVFFSSLHEGSSSSRSLAGGCVCVWGGGAQNQRPHTRRNALSKHVNCLLLCCDRTTRI